MRGSIPGTRRTATTVGGLALVGFCALLLCTQAQAAPLTASEGTGGVLVGGSQDEPVPITVTATKKGEGFARIGMPPPITVETCCGSFDHVLGIGDGLPQPQTTDPSLSGYVSLENDSCKRAKLVSVTAAQLPPTAKAGKATVRYSCRAGRQFTLTYAPRIDWLSQLADAGGLNKWAFSLSRRPLDKRRWTLLPSQPQIAVKAFTILQPNLLYTAPPAPLTDVVIDQGNLVLTTQGRLEDGSKTEAQLTTNFFFSGTGEPLAINPQPGAIDALVNPDQEPITVFGCNDASSPFTCTGTGAFGMIQVTAPPGVFTVGGNAYSGSVYLQAQTATLAYLLE